MFKNLETSFCMIVCMHLRMKNLDIKNINADF